MSKAPHKNPRRRSRELVIQGLYQWALAGGTAAEIERSLDDSEVDLARCDRPLFQSLLAGVIAAETELVDRFAVYLDRPYRDLSPVERSVLLLATYELVYALDVPYRVVINEAIELAKTFGGTDGYKYVNGVLDKLAMELRTSEIQAARVERP